jgi:glycine reductase
MGLHSPQAMSGSTATFGNGTYGRGQLAPPWLIHPNEILDGAVTGPYRTGFATSWTMSNNPVLLELYRRHGRELNFLGVIVVRTEWTTWTEKDLIGEQAAKLAKMLGADGALMTWDAGGNEFIEVIRTVQACERMGIKTVFLTSEDNSYDGAPTMLEPVPEADAIVSTGFYESSVQQIPEAPEMERVIGVAEMPTGPLRDQMVPATARMPVPRRYDDHYGFNRLSAIDF